MQKDMPTPGVRKNILALTPDERRKFFWCLKALGIIPAYQCNRNRYYHTYAPDGMNRVTPNNIHEEMVSSHATACEHRSFYFAYYHRHLMVYYEMQLNFADALLSGKQNLALVYPDFYSKIQGLWDPIVAKYQSFGGTGKMMAHYWNPTNYRNPAQQIIPIELSDPSVFAHPCELIDYLYRQVNGSFPWEINMKTKFFDPSSKFEANRDAFITTMTTTNQYFVTSASYSDNQNNILAGTLNPRTDINLFHDTYRKMIAFYTDPVTQQDNFPTTFQVSSKHNLDYFNRTNTNMSLYTFNRSQALVSMGSQALQMQWISYKQMAQLKWNRDQIVNGVDYNQLVPHYQLGTAILSHKIDKFEQYLTPGRTLMNIQTSHNTMHNNQRFSMIDGSFSLLNLMFFPYHSWIDLQLEFRVRKDQSQYQTVLNYLQSPKEFNQYFDYILYRNVASPIRGTYPIMEWANPQIKEIIDKLRQANPKVTTQELIDATKQFNEQDLFGVFKSQDYMLTGNTLRRSNQMSQIYAAYIQKFKSKYAAFEGFATYDVNYDYEVYETLANGDVKLTLIDQAKYYIPQYLQDMEWDVNLHFNTLYQNANKIALKLKLLQPIPYYLSTVYGTFSVSGSYSTKLVNGAYSVPISFEGLFECEDKFTELQRNIIKKGFNLFTLQVHGKASKASRCIRCGECKKFTVDVSEQIFMRFPKLWKAIHLYSLKKQHVLYDSEVKIEPEPYIENKTQNVEVKRPQFIKAIRLIRGADQVFFNIVTDLKGLIKFVQVSLDSISFFDGKPESTQHVIHEDFTKQIHFKNIVNHDIHKMNDTEFDEFIYSQAHVKIHVGESKSQFSFSIPNYHRIVTYNIHIAHGHDKNTLVVRVDDADYEFKRQFYESFQDSYE